MGKSKLKSHKLAEVLTDIETTVNSRPLTYKEEDIEFPFLTPNSFVLGQQLIIPNEDQKISKIKTYESARNTSRNARKLPGRDGEVNI